MPLPKVQDIFDSLQGANMVSVWDACAGYWQVLLREQDRHYTAFSDGENLYQFVRCPFGLSTSGSVFCRAMEKVLRRDDHGPLLNKTVGLIVDDGVIHTTLEQDHLEETARVLKHAQLWRNNATIKLCDGRV